MANGVEGSLGYRLGTEFWNTTPGTKPAHTGAAASGSENGTVVFQAQSANPYTETQLGLSGSGAYRVSTDPVYKGGTTG